MGPSATAIAEAIAKSNSIKMLDLSFNSICGNGKVELPMDEEDEKDKKDKKKPNKKKANDDLAKVGVAGAFYEEYAEKWAKMFRVNKSLVHVDLSHNHIKAIDCEIMADGLKANHNILGLHFKGNYAIINHLGFMEIGIPGSIAEESMITRMQKHVKGGVKNDKIGIAQEANSNCWICEGWSEVRFTYTPGVSDH